MTSLKILKEQNKQLKITLSLILQTENLQEKLKLLEKQSEVILFLEQENFITHLYSNLTDLEKVAVASVALIGQAGNIFRTPKHLSNTTILLKNLLKNLTLYEKFYTEIGGIVGYHHQVIELICEKDEKKDLSNDKMIHQAQGISIHEDIQEAQKAVLEGIMALPKMGEIYPIGGTGDRLNLTDETTGLPLPTAKLNYLGSSLLSCMVKDLQAREFLYFKLFNEQILTPIALMSSEAKNNHQFVKQILELSHWYHRPKESFNLFKQPLAPVITEDGTWAMSDHLKLFLKPSGHGVIWKLANELGVFDWFASANRPKALVRQMNNPIAGTDNGILALIGIGMSQDKAFGFASCQRLVHAAEGVNVLRETVEDGVSNYTISNIEYTEFEKYKLKDVPNSPNSPYSIFPSNTNILFIDFKAIAQALQKCSIPGMLINMKSEVPYIDSNGEKKMMKGGRLESTMQNIADFMGTSFQVPQDVSQKMDLPTFLTYNVRRKTISVTKKTYKGGTNINETPEGSYYSLMQNNFELLTKHCHMELPNIPSTSQYIDKGPSLHCLYHPSLGPLFSVIGQKIRGGKIANGSELILNLSELDMENLQLKGSLIIEANQPMGHLDEQKYLIYSHLSGKCTLKNVVIQNQGIDHAEENLYWKNEIKRNESVHIKLGTNSEFYAEDVTFNHDFLIEVPDNTRIIAKMDPKGFILLSHQEIDSPSWHWTYSLCTDNKIALKKELFQ